MKNYFLLLLICIFAAFHSNGQHTANYLGQDLDTVRLNKIARTLPKEQNWSKVARLIGDSCKTEIEQVYTIYTYIASNFKYDLDRMKLIYKREVKRELYLTEVMKKKSGVCGDFANLFVTLCDSLDIGCFRVSGYSRTFRLFHPVRKNYYNHAWNVVRVNGKWYPIDVTFGIQHFSNSRMNQPSVNYSFLFADPIKFGRIHLPADPIFQLVDQERSYKDFRYDKFLQNVPNVNTSKQDSLLNARLNKNWKDQLIDEAVAAQKFNPKVKCAGLKLLEVRINKVIDKKANKRKRLTRKDYEDAIYLYQGILNDLQSQNSKRRYIRYTNDNIQKLKEKADKLTT